MQKLVSLYLLLAKPVIVKELTGVLAPTFPDSSRQEPSGRGYFNGAYNGIDMSIKDMTSAGRPASECAGCHIANVAKTDMTWIQFYPLLRDNVAY